jgi:hypothetical protein
MAILVFCFVTLQREMTAGDLLVGLGTLLLATFTWNLARRTSKAVKISEVGLELSRESIEALDRPFVIATPDGNRSLLGFAEVGPEHPGWRFVYRLWNLGKGPAIVDAMSLVDAVSQREHLTQDELMERPVAMTPPVYDGLSRLEGNSPPATGSELTLRIWYRTASGTRYVSISRVKVTGNLSCICTDFRQEEAMRCQPRSMRVSSTGE